MILIADSGGSKVRWCVVDKEGPVSDFETPGMNAIILTADEMSRRIAEEVAPNLRQHADKISNVYFYGAGCVSDKIKQSVTSAIGLHIHNAAIEVASDLLGTCRALSGNRPGIVCILGTGANSCLYSGEAIVDNVPALGYILGDEGSGAYLGKALVGGVFKRQLPRDLCEAFMSDTALDAVDIIERVYRRPSPNKFLASLTPFLSHNIRRPEIRQLVANGFRAFFSRNVCHYGHKEASVHFCGSIAFVFNDILNEVAAEFGYRLGNLARDPMDGLIRYHSK